MSIKSTMFRLNATISDYLRDKDIPFPQGVNCCCNLPYGEDKKWNMLDVYYPGGTRGTLPTIVSIHGGGYVYGSKEIYRRYGMDMAKRGFAFINFNYRLAPKWKFPAPLEDTNAVMEWVCRNAQRYHLDPRRILLVGDSAGAQLASQYAAIATNKDYARHFSFTVPDTTIRALGLNCGMYDAEALAASPRKGIYLDYLGKALPSDDPRLKVLSAITGQYPPTFLTTACHDFLKDCAQPMCDHLIRQGVFAQCKCYGTESQKQIGHVFHVNISLPEAKVCNDDAAAFFKQYI